MTTTSPASADGMEDEADFLAGLDREMYGVVLACSHVHVLARTFSAKSMGGIMSARVMVSAAPQPQQKKGGAARATSVAAPLVAPTPAVQADPLAANTLKDPLAAVTAGKEGDAILPAAATADATPVARVEPKAAKTEPKAVKAEPKASKPAEAVVAVPATPKAAGKDASAT